MKRVELSQNKFALVDDEDFERVSAFRWTYMKNDRTAYAYRAFWQDGKLRQVLLHRFILDAPTGMQVHHRNHNGLDNRRQNIVICTPAQNRFGKLKSTTKQSSRYKGVYGQRDRRGWRAEVYANGIKHYLGTFTSELEAARAYDDAAAIHHGEYALFNLPRPFPYNDPTPVLQSNHGTRKKRRR